MRKLLTSIAAVAVIAIAGSVQATVINGSFETGDLTGWTASPNTLVNVVTSAPKLGESGSWSPADGSYFALLSTGQTGVYTLLSQAFNVSAGDILSLAVFFDAGDYRPYDDSGYVKVINVADNSETLLYSKSVSDVGDNGSSGWDSVSHAFASAGQFKIEMGVKNQLDSLNPSALGLDVVGITTSPVPEPGSIILLATGGIGLVGGAVRRQRARKTLAA